MSGFLIQIGKSSSNINRTIDFRLWLWLRLKVSFRHRFSDFGDNRSSHWLNQKKNKPNSTCNQSLKCCELNIKVMQSYAAFSPIATGTPRSIMATSSKKPFLLHFSLLVFSNFRNWQMWQCKAWLTNQNYAIKTKCLGFFLMSVSRSKTLMWY